jgi:hypothetical protein
VLIPVVPATGSNQYEATPGIMLAWSVAEARLIPESLRSRNFRNAEPTFRMPVYAYGNVPALPRRRGHEQKTQYRNRHERCRSGPPGRSDPYAGTVADGCSPAIDLESVDLCSDDTEGIPNQAA